MKPQITKFALAVIARSESDEAIRCLEPKNRLPRPLRGLAMTDTDVLLQSTGSAAAAAQVGVLENVARALPQNVRRKARCILYVCKNPEAQNTSSCHPGDAIISKHESSGIPAHARLRPGRRDASELSCISCKKMADNLHRAIRELGAENAVSVVVRSGFFWRVFMRLRGYVMFPLLEISGVVYTEKICGSSDDIKKALQAALL